MAARKNKGTKDNPWPDSVRSKIQSSMLLNRLEKHVVGKVEMSPTQVRAAEVLLKKSLPDLQPVDESGDSTQKVKVSGALGWKPPT